MGYVRASSLVCALALAACAETQTPKPKPPAPSPKVQAANAESMAQEAERHINAADNACAALNPDTAAEELKAAKPLVYDERIDSYPDAKDLRKRYQALSTRVPEVREEVRKRELAAQVKAAKDKIDEVHKELKDALAAIKKKHPDESDLKRAVEALAKVKAALEEGAKLEDKDPEYSKYAIGIQKELSGVKGSVEQREIEVTAGNQRTEIESLRTGLSASAKRVAAKAPSASDFDDAKNALASLDKALEGAKAIAAKDAPFAKYLEGAKKSADSVRAMIDKRKLEVDATQQKGAVQLVEAAATAKVKAVSRKQSEATAEEVTAAEEAVKALKDELDKGAAIEKTDKHYADYASSVRKGIARSQKDIEEAKLMSQFHDKPVQSLTKGQDEAASASALAAGDRKTAYTSALEAFKSCKQEGASLIADHPKLASTMFAVGKKRLKGTAVLAACSEGIQSIETKLSKVNATLAFYDGPGKSFSKGKALLGEKAYADALAQFESCLETGRMLEHRHPELKTAKFDLDGQSVTLPGVVSNCQKEAKTLRTSVKKGEAKPEPKSEAKAERSPA